MPSVKQDDVKYYLLSLSYYSTWDFIQITRVTCEHSTY